MPKRTCSVDGCEKRRHGDGLCQMHRWRLKHHGSLDSPLRPTIERFDEKVERTPDCWLWNATRNNQGYGQFWDGEDTVLAHRWSYEHFVAPIPVGLVLDHLCRTPACVNPNHLEPVTQHENILRGTAPAAQHARKTHCQRGHEFDEANTYRDPRGRRTCRTCVNEQRRESRRLQRESSQD